MLTKLKSLPPALLRFSKNSKARIDQKKKIADYFKNTNEPKLHLGCGPIILSGWMNCDYNTTRAKGVIYLNLLKRFPCDDESFNYVYCCHTIEHFTPEQMNHIFSETYRVLKHGGVFRLEWPSLDKLIALYNSESLSPGMETFIFSKKSTFRGEKIINLNTLINEMFYNSSHQYLADYKTMVDFLTQIEFIDFGEEKNNQSLYEALRNLAKMPAGGNKDVHNLWERMTTFLECKKSAKL